MSKIVQFIAVWLPPVVWMVLIFIFSSQPRLSVSGDFSVDFIAFKSLHILAYAILYTLLYRAFYKTGERSGSALVYALVTTILYAVSDELHQTLVPTRSGRFTDVGFDTIGAVSALYLIKKYAAVLRKLHFL